MVISSVDFQAWLDSKSLPTNVSELARYSTIHRSTLGHQMNVDRIKVTTIVTIARVAKLDPLTELSRFTPFEDLEAGTSTPTQRELLSQVSHGDALAEILRRSEERHRSDSRRQITCESLPFPESTKAWFDAIDTGDLRRRLAESSGIAPSNLSSLLTENKLPPALAVNAARLSRSSLSSGLVVIGLLTAEEGRWPPRAREDCLRAVDELTLIDLATAKLSAWKRLVKRKADAANISDFVDALG